MRQFWCVRQQDTLDAKVLRSFVTRCWATDPRSTENHILNDSKVIFQGPGQVTQKGL